MSATAAPVGAPAGATTGAGTEGGGASGRWRRTRSWVLGALVLALTLAVAVWTVRDAEEYPDPLDPGNSGPTGAQAVAEVLGDEGVDVTVARSADELEDTEVDGGTTVVVTSTQHLAASTLERLRDHAAPGRLVLVEPDYALLRQLDGDLVVTIVDGPLSAECGRVDGIDLEGLVVEVDRASSYGGRGCFPVGAQSVLVRDPARDLLLFGAGEALSNDQVLRADNAAVALRLLGEDERLVWYVPDPADATGDDAVTVGSLLPDWIGPALWLTALAAIGLVLWRFRRLGPLTTEPLPVVVRAVETARSRGRMYRKGGDRAHAAQALRRATRSALATRLRLDRRADAATIAGAAARHLGRPVEEVAALLADDGPPPANDRDLVRLAQELARLQDPHDSRNEVRRR